MLEAILLGLLSGAMIPLGGAIASVEHIRPAWLEDEFRHSVIAFGGGVLMAAVAFVLAPRGMETLSPAMAIGTFALGGVLFALFERLSRGDGNAQFAAMLTDFVPEALALGAMVATRDPVAALLAFLIGLQNLPEGFNAFREIKAGGRLSDRRILTLFAGLAVLGPLASAFGYSVLISYPGLTSAIMMIAAGGILYLTFQSIAIAAHMTGRQAPSLAALGGFAFGMLGEMLVV